MSDKKTIDTLVEDIYAVLDEGVEGSWKVDEAFEVFAETLSSIIKRRLVKGEEEHNNPIRLSAIGTSCGRKMWYKIHRPEDEEPLSPSTKLKFMFGDVIEALILLLADLAGHEVSHEQEEVYFHGVPGHIDAKVDGVICDVKSASSLSFKKFKEGLSADTDTFGYLFQLGSYVGCADSLGADPSVGAFIAVDKQHGHIAVDKHVFTEKNFSDIRERIEWIERLANSSSPPVDRLAPEPDGKSGNMKLCTTCSYCGFKKVCWPNIRMFLYSTGPRYLVEVKKEPKVPEVKDW